MLRKLVVLSLLLMAFGCTSLNAQNIAYVTNLLDNTVSAIDTSTNTVTATIPVGNQPNGIVFSPDHTRAYVTNRGTHDRAAVSVIDTASNTVAATLDVPGSDTPIFPAISPDGKTLYIPSEFNNTVVVFDIASGTVRATIPIFGEPCGVAITPNGRRGYVSTAAADVGTVWVFDTSTNTVIDAQHYVTVFVNYSVQNQNRQVLDKYPKIFEYPHFLVLDGTGKLLASQGTSVLEQGETYNSDKMGAFLRKWASQSSHDSVSSSSLRP
jgi:YVTN family beta-propeller protein